MRHDNHGWTKLANALVVLVLATLYPASPLCTYSPHRPPRIPDKVEILVAPPLSADSLASALKDTEAELAEMGYYLRLHDVTDEGYNLVANYHTTLTNRKRQLQEQLKLTAEAKATRKTLGSRRLTARERPLTAVKYPYGHWRAGHFHRRPLTGAGVTRDAQGRVVSAVWVADSVVTAMRTDSTGLYRGQMNARLQADGQGTLDTRKGCHYEGLWQDGKRSGFGFESSPLHPVRVGQWSNDRFLGEKLRYTTDRIYGIDISRHQHEKGRRRYAINWRKVRITSLGKRHDTEGHTYPVSFVYIKATEGTTIRNRYFAQDYTQARRRGIKAGAYHFFSLKSTPQAQVQHFLRYARIASGDFPPVLDVEPTDAQVRQIGGKEELLRRIRTWLQLVEKRTGRRPVLYVSQMFVNKYLQDATDIKQHYNVWIARYGQYKPDVKLAFWQLAADGRVDGITGPVDINVFNGYQGQWDEFLRTGFHQ